MFSEVRIYHGLPTLFVNGQPMNEPAYITYLTERADYARFAATGGHLYSVTIFFGRQTINERSQIHPFAPGVFDVKGQPDYSTADGELQRILDADPDALIFPRVNTSLPRWWEDEHPDELNDEGYGGNRRRPCFASDAWLEAVAAGLRDMAAHFAASPYAEHIIGYQIAGGNTEEWFSFDQKGGIGLRSRQKWAAERTDTSTDTDFYAFLSTVTAKAIAELARRMKIYTDHRLVIGSFYGYTFETPYREANHAALSTLLQCGDLDFICSPMSYAETRRPGVDHACMTALDSVLFHGKLYFSEVDERTYRSERLADSREDSCEPGTYEEAIWFGPRDAETSRQVLLADFARQLIHGCSYWWFDMWGGWYDDVMMSDFKAEKAVLTRALGDEDRSSSSEAVVYIDEKSHTLCRPGEGTAAYAARVPLGASGVPYDSFEAADFEATFEKYRAFVLIEAARTPRMDEIKRRLTEAGRPCLVITNDTPLSPALFRDFFRQCGLHVWCETDDVVHANRHWVSIHAAEAGEKRLKLPRVCRIEPQFGAGDTAVSDEIVVNLPHFATRLYRIEPIE